MSVPLGSTVKVARDLNASGRWTIYAREGGRWKPALKVDSLRLADVSFTVSTSTLARIRTPKGATTASGAQGLGKRTVCAFAVGTLKDLSAAPSEIGSPRLTFNPFRDDGFKVDGGDAPDRLADLAFLPQGVVEVVA